MHVLVTGATGFIGSHLVQALLDLGHEVSACARNTGAVACRFPSAKAIRLDLRHLPSRTQWLAHLQDVDVVINTVGIIAESPGQTFVAVHVEFSRLLFAACEAAGVKRVIQLSALGAEPGASTLYHHTKYLADTHLRGFGFEKVIVKPSLVFGSNGQSSAFFRALAAQPLWLLIDHGRQCVQPIHIDDLTAALVQLVTQEEVPLEVAAVGPAAITFDEMLAGYRRWLGYGGAGKGAPFTISVPYSFALFAARALRFLNNPFLNPDNLRMLHGGNTANPATMTALLGRPSHSFAAALSRTTATEADRWHARLYFLLPLLRLAIACIWLYTGVISAFVYPQSESYALLRQVGLYGWMLPASLYPAAALDVALGIAVLLRFRPRLIGLVQLLVIASYTLIISVFLPEFWLHPFGPVAKNIPFMAAILVTMAVERK
ncbi:MAG TPA: NAD(P)H-binding protein [Hyphomicrobiales bacterium]|nr:NAD(P)H-binding protein [Hyphomicrobiales bacterium]